MRLLASGGGLLAAAMAAHNVWRVRQLRRTAAGLAGDLVHDRQVGEGLGTPLHLVVVGDSAARGFGLPRADDALPFHAATRLASATGRRVRVTSLARDGARTADVVREQVPLLRGQDVDAVVAMVGVNDVIRRTPRRELESATAELLRLLELVAPSVLIGVPDIGRAPGLPRPLSWLVGRRCVRVEAAQRRAAARSRVAFVATRARTVPELFGEDGLHPGPDAARLVARQAVEALLAASDPAALTVT